MEQVCTVTNQKATFNDYYKFTIVINNNETTKMDCLWNQIELFV